MVKVENKLYYNLKTFRQKGYFNELNNIREHVTLVQLVDSLGNINHAINVVGCCILDSNYENSLVLNIESLDITCAPSVG